MNKTVLKIIEKSFIRDPWKKADFYKKHGIFYHVGDNCYIASHVSFTEGYLISIGDNVWITSGVQFINHDASSESPRLSRARQSRGDRYRKQCLYRQQLHNTSGCQDRQQLRYRRRFRYYKKHTGQFCCSREPGKSHLRI